MKNMRNKCEKLIQDGANIEDLLEYMRRTGLSIVESMALLIQLKDMSLVEAKRVVHHSATWADLRDAHDQFHDELFSSIEKVIDSPTADSEVESVE